MITPRISLVAYGDRNPGFIFVAVPDERGVYFRTDRSVALVPCCVCGSVTGEPCRGAGNKYTAGTHWKRRTAARGYAKPHDVLAPEPIPDPTPDEFMGDNS